MTQKLYHDDAYQQEFQAQVLERVTVSNGLGLILDQTCFYPTSGGQPHDQGTLNGIPVSDVFEREDDGAVVHVLGGEVEGPVLSTVEGPVLSTVEGLSHRRSLCRRPQWSAL